MSVNVYLINKYAVYEMASLPLNYRESHLAGPYQPNSLPYQIKNEFHIYMYCTVLYTVDTVFLEC